MENLEKDSLPEVLVINEGLLVMHVCAAIPPEKMDEIPSKMGNPGTSYGRWEFPDFEKHHESKPVECGEYEGRWHYVLNC